MFHIVVILTIYPIALALSESRVVPARVALFLFFPLARSVVLVSFIYVHPRGRGRSEGGWWKGIEIRHYYILDKCEYCMIKTNKSCDA